MKLEMRVELRAKSWNAAGFLVCDSVFPTMDRAVSAARKDSVRYELSVGGRVIESAVLVDDTDDGGLCWWEEEMTGRRF